MNVSRQETLHAAHDLGLDAAHVADDATGFDLRQKCLSQRHDGLHRRSHHEEIDAGGKLVFAQKIAVDDAVFLGEPKITFATAITDNLADELAAAHVQGERSADQADTGDNHFLKHQRHANSLLHQFDRSPKTF